MLKIIAPQIGGVKDSQGKLIQADEKIEGGPSVVFDAVAILTSPEGAKTLAGKAAARDFVSDAYNHFKFIAYHPDASPLLERAGVASVLDDGCLSLAKAEDCQTFVENCRQFRYWERKQP